MENFYNSLNEFAKNYGIYVSIGYLAFATFGLIVTRKCYLDTKKWGKKLTEEINKTDSELKSIIEEGIHDDLEQKFFGGNRLN